LLLLDAAEEALTLLPVMTSDDKCSLFLSLQQGDCLAASDDSSKASVQYLLNELLETIFDLHLQVAEQGFDSALIPEDPLPVTAENCSRIIIDSLLHELVQSVFDLHSQNILRSPQQSDCLATSDDSSKASVQVQYLLDELLETFFDLHPQVAKQGFEIVLIPENPLPVTAENCSRIIIDSLLHELVQSAFYLTLFLIYAHKWLNKALKLS